MRGLSRRLRPRQPTPTTQQQSTASPNSFQLHLHLRDRGRQQTPRLRPRLKERKNTRAVNAPGWTSPRRGRAAPRIPTLRARSKSHGVAGLLRALRQHGSAHWARNVNYADHVEKRHDYHDENFINFVPMHVSVLFSLLVFGFRCLVSDGMRGAMRRQLVVRQK